MKKYLKLIKNFSLLLTIGFTLGFSTLSANALSPNFASVTGATGAACAGINSLDANSGCGTKNGTSSVSNIVTTVVNILSMIIGIVAVIMIIFAGFRFITANGDSNAISSARDTIIYAIVGIIIAILAQFIVRHVIGTSANIQSGMINSVKVLTSYS